MQPDCFVDVNTMAKLAVTPMPLSDLQVARSEPSNAPHLITGLFLKRMQELGGVAYLEVLNRKRGRGHTVRRGTWSVLGGPGKLPPMFVQE